MSRLAFKRRGSAAIYHFEMARFRRTPWQSVATPVLTTVLYFVVFGSAIGSIDGAAYAAFIVPELMLLTVFTESFNNASFGIYMPRFTGTIYPTLSAPVSTPELVAAQVGAAATKSVVLGLLILATASLFNPIVYIISGFRYCFFGSGDASIWISLVALTAFIVAALAAIAWIVRSGYRLGT